MSGSIRRRASCRLCDGQDFVTVLSLTPTPPANAFVAPDRAEQEQTCFPLDLQLCRSCKHAQLLDVVDPALLFKDYVYVSGTSPSFVAHFERYAETVIDRFGLGKDSLIVDVGSNDGTLLSAFKKRGMRVLGVDPAHRLAKAASERGLETLAGFFTKPLAIEIVETHGRASAVTANNVFAHADDLREILSGVRELLKPNGVFVFEVSYLLDVVEKTLFDTIYHEHLSYHSVAPLVQFFAKNGFELFSVERVDTHGGSIRGYAQANGSRWRADGTTAALTALERDREIDDPHAFAAFSAHIQTRKTELLETLSPIKAAGGRIVGFGAPAKATTLMYHFELGPLMSYIVDDSPLKQGLLSPGYHIPVHAARKLYDEVSPPHVLVLAWNFAAAIVRNHANLRERGARFIIPLPTVQVL